MVFARLTKRLDRLGFTEDAARWAVDSWAYALGLPVSPPPKKVEAGLPADTLIKPAERAAVEPVSPGVEPPPAGGGTKPSEVLSGTRGGGELLGAKKSILSFSPAKALFIPAVFAIGVVILVVYFYFTSVVPLRTLTGHTGSVMSVAFSPDGRTLASGGRDTTIKLWDSASGQLLRTLTGHTGYVRSVAFSPDGRTLASGSWEDSTIKLWDVASGQLMRTLNSVMSGAFSPDGRTLASEGGGTIELWDVASGQLLRTLIGDTGLLNSVAFSPDGRTLAGGAGNTIKLWGVVSGQLLRTLTAGGADARLGEL